MDSKIIKIDQDELNLHPCNCSCSCPYCSSRSKSPLNLNIEQIKSIKDLCAELEEERAASSIAASEAMSMIFRLQRDKAEAQMDARQFKILAEEKMSHDQEEIFVLEDLLFKRDQALQSLQFEILGYRRRLLCCGIDPESFVRGNCLIENGDSRFGRGEFLRGEIKERRNLVKEIGRKIHKRIVKKISFWRSFYLISVFKWMASLFFWRKKSPRIKYPIGLSNQKAGLLILLERSQRKRLRRCLTRLPR